ncbi:anti-sigma factor [Maliponia aquimaris]|uniref:Regulator of SigK n=1 Tax=Maliponia aquimaris TaxID=1673631 RepID=A0A238KLR3_9RHOB|nr:anti-sigma factor [Maliponia aquimaris]SMX43567.1 Anti-sigma-K factor rskA [Maliponia aquimaris]
MKRSRDRDLPGGWEAGAAEYALGLMPREEIAGFEARLAAEPDLQQDVAAWTEYFACFVDAIAEETPPPQVLRRIEARVFGPVEKTSVIKQVLPYFVGAVAGAAIAWLVFATGLLDPAQPVLGADLVAAAGDLALTAALNPETGVLVVARTAGEVGEGRVLELWLSPETGAAVSLALLRTEETLVALPPALSDGLEGARLLVTEEPAGGAPDGMPGAVRAEGRLVAR